MFWHLLLKPLLQPQRPETNNIKYFTNVYYPETIQSDFRYLLSCNILHFNQCNSSILRLKCLHRLPHFNQTTWSLNLILPAWHFYGECTTSRCTNCPQTFYEKIFYLYVSFLSLSTIKIVSQKLVILHGLSQKLVTGFLPTVSFMTDAESFFPQCSHTRTLSFSVTLAVCLFPLLSVLV